jgi:alkyl sulfatase BDS1-like metallo-beta-lactamase superfamily hydrolase
MCLFLNFESKSQIKQLLKQGLEANENKDYSSAAQIYNQIILIDSSKIEYQLLFADASRLNYDNETAFHWYQKIYKKDNGKILENTKRQKNILINIIKKIKVQRILSKNK